MDTQFREALTARLPAALRFLRELVEINSFTHNPEGVNANAARIIWQFSRLGFEEKLIPCDLEKSGNHLVLDSGGDGPVIACISHLDTVFTAQEELAQDFQWREEANRVYGPGTYDIKGGTALLWLMLDTLAEVDPLTFKRFRWILLWDAAEEVLSPDFTDLCLSLLPEQTRCVLVMEGDNAASRDEPEYYEVLRGRKGTAQFHLRVHGRGAHAGGGHQDGASAVAEIARLITRLEGMTDHGRGVTVNVGTVCGGQTHNRVPHDAEARLEMRAYDRESFEQTREAILGLQGLGEVRAVSDGCPTRVEVELQTREAPPWNGENGTEALVALWEAAGSAAGLKVGAGRRGGVSDGSFLAHRFPVIDGLGPRGGNPHASEYAPDRGKLPEFIDTGSLVPKALVNLLAIRGLAAEMDKPAQSR